MKRSGQKVAVRLIATDLDGTFLDGDSQYDANRLRQLLKACKEKGIYFVVASGRSLKSVKSVFADFVDDVIFLGENGAVAEYQGQILYEELMSKDLYLTIVQKIEDSHFQNQEMIHLSSKSGAYILSTIHPEYHAFLAHYYPVMHVVESFSDVDDEIYKVGANFEAGELHEASQWLTDTISGVISMTSGYECLDVMSEHVNKGTALRHLCHALGVTADEVVAFGDNSNDAEMLKFAGTAVVPENARLTIQELADIVIGDHKTGSVINYMEEIVCPSN